MPALRNWLVFDAAQSSGLRRIPTTPLASPVLAATSSLLLLLCSRRPHLFTGTASKRARAVCSRSVNHRINLAATTPDPTFYIVAGCDARHVVQMADILHHQQNTADANGDQKLGERIAMAIGIDITGGGISEGALLPTEQDAVRKYNVSRATYREAIRTLASKGLVASRPKTGTRVNARRSWAILDPEVIRWMFSNEPTAALVQALFELRTVIEPQAAAMAAERRSAEQLLVLGRALDRMATHGYRSAEGQAADGEFHSAILEATGNDFLIGMEQSIATAVQLTTKLKAAASETPRDPIPLHLDVYSAIADRDAERARLAALTLLEIAREDTELLVQH